MLRATRGQLSKGGLCISKFEGHVYNKSKNMWILLQEARPLVVMPTTYFMTRVVKYAFAASLPLFVHTWSFTPVVVALCTFVGRLAAKGPSNHVVKDLRGKNVVITGATRGIGLQAAIQLSQMGANIHLVARDGPLVEDAMRQIRNAAPPRRNDAAPQEFRASSVDFTDLAAVRDFTASFAKEGTAVDILVNNAAALKFENKKTVSGDDEMLAVNLLSPYLMTEGLLPLVQKASGRVVNTGSSAHAGVTPGALLKYLHEQNTDPKQHNALEHYGFTKLGLIFHTQQLAVRAYQHDSSPAATPTFVACCANPGGVVTDIYRDIGIAAVMFKYFYYPFLLLMRSPYEGSQTIVNCCVRDDIVNGGCYMDCTHMPDSLSEIACDVKERTTVLEWVHRKVLRFPLEQPPK